MLLARGVHELRGRGSCANVFPQRASCLRFAQLGLVAEASAGTIVVTCVSHVIVYQKTIWSSFNLSQRGKLNHWLLFQDQALAMYVYTRRACDLKSMYVRPDSSSFRSAQGYSVLMHQDYQLINKINDWSLKIRLRSFERISELTLRLWSNAFILRPGLL